MEEIKRLILLLCLFIPISAHADFTVQLYEIAISGKGGAENRSKIENYVAGLGRGIYLTNVVAGMQNQKALFCVPKSLLMDSTLLISLLDQEIREPSKKYREDTPISIILLGSFIHRFPCASQ